MNFFLPSVSIASGVRLMVFVGLLGLTLQACGQQKSNEAAKPLVCGHRGGFYTSYPENSIALINDVIAKAGEFPVMIEIDIRKSKDGTLYILHDETVDRTTNGTGKIADLTDDYLSELYLKNSSGELSDQRIVRFDLLLAFLKNKNCQLMLDIKADDWLETAKLVLQKGWTEKSMFITFNPVHTKLLTDYSDKLVVSALIKTQEDWDALKNIPMVPQKRFAYVPRDASVEFINKLKQAGYNVTADVSEFTTHDGVLYDQSHYVNLAKEKKLDVLITDFPIEVIQFLNK